MPEKFDSAKPMQVGGQAVIEGVMMRGPGVVATAVRRADGSITVRKDPYHSLAERNKLWKLPVLRGSAGLVEMMLIGVRMLNFSAEMVLRDEQPAAAPEAKPKKEQGTLALTVTVGIALLVGMAVFFATPLLITTLFFGVSQDPVRFNLIAGVVRVTLLIGYLGAISLLKDVQRLFQYHGAEHKSIFAFEKGEELTVAAAAKQTRFHPRCGTSFLLIVMVVSIVLFALVDALLISMIGPLGLATRLATHLPLVPFVGGISYEFIKYSAKKCDTPVGRMIVAPGLWLQKITTKEPDARQLEVALAALRAAIGEEAPQIPGNDGAFSEVPARIFMN